MGASGWGPGKVALHRPEQPGMKPTFLEPCTWTSGLQTVSNRSRWCHPVTGLVMETQANYNSKCQGLETGMWLPTLLSTIYEGPFCTSSCAAPGPHSLPFHGLAPQLTASLWFRRVVSPAVLFLRLLCFSTHVLELVCTFLPKSPS